MRRSGWDELTDLSDSLFKLYILIGRILIPLFLLYVWLDGNADVFYEYYVFYFTYQIMRIAVRWVDKMNMR